MTTDWQAEYIAAYKALHPGQGIEFVRRGSWYALRYFSEDKYKPLRPGEPFAPWGWKRKAEFIKMTKVLRERAGFPLLCLEREPDAKP